MKNKIEKDYNDINTHPVSFVSWVDAELVQANDYNPNKVAPPEMKLLEVSILSDGFTQPIVTWKREDGIYEVIDGFHRHLVGKKMGLKLLPVVVINKGREDKGDRISSTIRHNRARGKHVVKAMSEIVIELKNRNWKNERIAKELGMEEDEILRLCQITGLASLFKDEEFSKSWDIKDSIPDEELKDLDDVIDQEEKEKYGFRTVNTNDPKRIFHTYEKWECYKAGFYEPSHPTMSKDEYEKEYANFLKNDKLFKRGLRKVISKWKHSCEHYLTNASMNRIAWLGQAAVCAELKISSEFRAGYHLLTEEEQEKANRLALKYLNKWLVKNKRKKVSLNEAMPDRQATIY
jgi:hypothetical protein